VKSSISQKVVHINGLAAQVLIKHGGAGKDATPQPATPLLILNGAGATVAMITPLLELLDGRDVIAFDMPDAKKSNQFHVGWRMKHYAAFTRDLLDELGYPSVNVLGYSWGGALAQEFVRRYPERCNRLILAATSPGHIMVPGRVFFSPLKFRMKSLWSPKALTDMALARGHENVSTEQSKNQPEFALSYTAPRIYLQQTLALFGWSSLGWLRKINVKTLVMHAKDDILVSKMNASILSCLIPKAELHLVEDGGHVFPFHHRGEFKKVVSRFLLA